MKDREVGGAVYVYINQAGRWEGITPIRLNGTKDSMFGLAVENIGDINQDSHKGNLPVWLIFIFCTCKSKLDYLFIYFLNADIAVGAPYDDGGTGKVYIYHGSVGGIKTSPAQVSFCLKKL